MDSDLISQFLDIAATEDTLLARHFLESTNWDLDQALLLFFAGNETTQQLPSPPRNNEDDVSAPLPVRRDTLYGNSPTLRRRHYPIRESGWESSGHDNLKAMFDPPHKLMFFGTFEEAKVESQRADRWLVVNLQSMSEFKSHLLNRDVWSNEVVSETVRGNFIFWQEYNDTVEGLKVMTYYKVESAPAILVIDPMTGQMMRSWFGAVEAEVLLEDLLVFMDKSPNDNLNALMGKMNCRVSEQVQGEVKTDMEVVASSWGDEDEYPVEEELPLMEDSGPEYPPLPEEPIGDRALLCRVVVRFPDGQKMQRNFLKSDPIQLLWSFCYSKLEESHKQSQFCLINALPGRSTRLDYENEVTFEESGIANSMITVVCKDT